MPRPSSQTIRQIFARVIEENRGRPPEYTADRIQEAVSAAGWVIILAEEEGEDAAGRAEAARGNNS